MYHVEVAGVRFEAVAVQEEREILVSTLNPLLTPWWEGEEEEVVWLAVHCRFPRKPSAG